MVLCGTVVPDGYGKCVERRYFTEIQYLALVCEDSVMEDRLKGRPGWRNSSNPEFIETMKDFNQWIKANAHKTNPPMAILDNTRLTIDETVDRIVGWIHSRL